MVSVVVPTYNERDNIEQLLSRLAAVRASLREPLEVLVVDDCSPDGTSAYAQTLLAHFGLGRVIEREGARDLTLAVLHGVSHAKGNLIGVMDADLSHPPELLPILVQAVRSGYEVAIASRYVPGGRVLHWPWSRRILSRVGNLMAWPLVSVADANSGYFVAEAQLLQTLPSTSTGFKIFLEILVRGHVHRVQEVPYVFANRLRGTSKLDRRILQRYLAQLWHLYRYRWLQRRTHPCAGIAPSDRERGQKLLVSTHPTHELLDNPRC